MGGQFNQTVAQSGKRFNQQSTNPNRPVVRCENESCC
jgi:hypothetical protein